MSKLGREYYVVYGLLLNIKTYIYWDNRSMSQTETGRAEKLVRLPKMLRAKYQSKDRI
jgi:hypothetical protein